MKQSIGCLSAKGTNPCFGGGSISSLLVSATGTNKTTEPNKFTKNDDSSALVISWATEPGWVPHYISQYAFSSEKRINVGIFYRCRRKQFCKVYNTHKKIGRGIEDKPGSLYRHDSKSTVGLLLLFFKGNVLRAHSQSSRLQKKTPKNPHMQFQLLKEQFHPDKNSSQLGLTYSSLVNTSQGTIIFKGVRGSLNC